MAEDLWLRPDSQREAEPERQTCHGKPKRRVISPVCCQPATEGGAAHASERGGGMQQAHPCPFVVGGKVRRQRRTTDTEAGPAEHHERTPHEREPAVAARGKPPKAQDASKGQETEP
jgi:hypothetical protein